MRILISGASGFIGSALVPHLRAENHEVVALHRRTNAQPPPPWWDPQRGEIDVSPAGPFEAVIHLAGENIMGRWTEQKKKRLHDSRVGGTSLLARALAALPVKPKTLISTSAIGFYGNRGDEILDETSPPGSGILADICRAWEQAAAPAVEAGIRVAFLRIGLVLGRDGGALGKMLPVFRLGLGGRLGHGSQYWSWVAIDDVVQAISFILDNPAVRGPVNMVAPNAVTNRDFTAALARLVRRPAFFSVPAFALRMIFGREMANEMFLSSVRVQPKALEQHGYRFAFPSIEPALRHLLGKQ